MTRAKTVAWTWYCDGCGASSGDLTTTQSRLPSPSAMRARGWYIAKKWGDLCPPCLTKKQENGDPK